ncbi:Hypothetical_protein [Hexamita inflata]|uniref:Hypothetical_protein n=1 Tax=Hexamita inflata TaxID=28002 RepID=A0AA86UIA3_9EUKA|nr:Hypothetical protein HINF_LOCUS46978 [Hexamita inflata]CAI9959335.1 Hypothetical protein HINF_LOCUS46980 [Hexamita inflata]
MMSFRYLCTSSLVALQSSPYSSKPWSRSVFETFSTCSGKFVLGSALDGITKLKDSLESFMAVYITPQPPFWAVSFKLGLVRHSQQKRSISLSLQIERGRSF